MSAIIQTGNFTPDLNQAYIVDTDTGDINVQLPNPNGQELKTLQILALGNNKVVFTNKKVNDITGFFIQGNMDIVTLIVKDNKYNLVSNGVYYTNGNNIYRTSINALGVLTPVNIN